MSDMNQAIFSLIEALVEEWETLYTTEEVACDEAKVDLMLKATLAQGNVPDRVRSFYEKVFLRDIWDRDR